MDEKLLAGIAIESVSIAKLYDADNDVVGMDLMIKVKADGAALTTAGYDVDANFTADDDGVTFTFADAITFATHGE